MDILNFFFIGIILYLCYKIFTVNELFQNKIDLSNKKILLNRNLAINMNENKLEELNKLDIDLSKNNLLIDNKYNNKISIKKNLCIGNFCINKEKLKLIGGKIDAPQFYKKDSNGILDSQVYYNHDCNLTNKNNKYCEINTVKDLPDQLCFNYINEKSSNQEKICIGPNEFDILKGKRGIKLKNIDSNKAVTNSLDDTKYQTLEKSYYNPKYVMPYYANFRGTGMDIESTTDQLLFKNNNQCTNTSTLYKENPDFNPRKYPYYKDKKSELNCYNVDCDDPLQSRQCLHKCSQQILSRENNKQSLPKKPYRIKYKFGKKGKEAFDKDFKKWEEDKIKYDKSVSNKNKLFDVKMPNNDDIPKIIDNDGWINDPNWIRVCKEDLAKKSVFKDKNKKIYCLKYKSKDIDKPYDGPRSSSLSSGDIRRQGSRKYSCDGRPNWMMEWRSGNSDTGVGGEGNPRDKVKKNLDNIIKTYSEKHPDGENVYRYPYHLLYGDQIDQGEETNDTNIQIDGHTMYKNNSVKYNYPDGSNYANKEIYNEIMKSYKDDLLISWGNNLSESADHSTEKLQGDLKRGVLRHNYKWGTGRENMDGWCCNKRYGYGKDNYNNDHNKVNDCIDDYNIAMDIADPEMGELSDNNNHGWFILPETENIDPNYNGYYIDENNNNTKYIVHDNAIAKAAKFLGNVDNHRVSHDGVCGKDENSYPNLKYFCNGPNAVNPLYNSVCNPITHQHSNILNCMNEKRGIDIIDSLGTWPTRPSVDQVQTDEKGDNEVMSNNFDDDLETCIQQNNNETIIKEKPNEEHIDEQFQKLNDLDELNYFIKPSQDNSGDLIKSNTYFHAHGHIHDK